ncbi:hypothetical protein HN011_010032, partial [Eciton burchellii]
AAAAAATIATQNRFSNIAPPSPPSLPPTTPPPPPPSSPPPACITASIPVTKRKRRPSIPVFNPISISVSVSVSVLHLRSRNCGFNQSSWIPTSSTCRDYIAATGGLKNFSSVWRTRRLPFRHSRQ